MANNIVTLRSVYKVKEYHLQPTKQPNGANWPWVKRVRYDANGQSEMILSEAELRDPNSEYFIPEDMDIVVTDGTTFNLDDPFDLNRWNSIKNSSLIAPNRYATDDNGTSLIDGTKARYGVAELVVDVPGEDSKRSVSKRKLITRACTFVENDSVDGRLTKCKLLGKIMKNAPSTDVEDFLYQKAESNPQLIIDLYTNGDTALKLLLIDAVDNNIVRKKSGMYYYGETVIGSTEDAVITYFKHPTNKGILDMIKKETYPDYMARIIEERKPSEEVVEEVKKTKTAKK